MFITQQIIFVHKLNHTHGYIDDLPIKTVYYICFQDCSESFDGILMHDLTHVKPFCFGKERQPMKQMSCWKQHILDDNCCTYVKQLVFTICLLKRQQFNINQAAIKESIRIVKVLEENKSWQIKHAMQSLPFFTGETHQMKQNFRQMLHPSGKLPMSFWWQ